LKLNGANLSGSGEKNENQTKHKKRGQILVDTRSLKVSLGCGEEQISHCVFFLSGKTSNHFQTVTAHCCVCKQKNYHNLMKEK
jgi:sucrose-6-phosphate hydrolase SacC (GH32 family)